MAPGRKERKRFRIARRKDINRIMAGKAALNRARLNRKGRIMAESRKTVSVKNAPNSVLSRLRRKAPGLPGRSARKVGRANRLTGRTKGHKEPASARKGGQGPSGREIVNIVRVVPRLQGRNRPTVPFIPALARRPGQGRIR